MKVAEQRRGASTCSGLLINHLTAAGFFVLVFQVAEAARLPSGGAARLPGLMSAAATLRLAARQINVLKQLWTSMHHRCDKDKCRGTLGKLAQDSSKSEMELHCK